MGFRVEGVTEASLTSDCLLHACCSIHGGGWLGLVHQPKECATLKGQGGEGGGEGRGGGGGLRGF